MSVTSLPINPDAGGRPLRPTAARVLDCLTEGNEHHGADRELAGNLKRVAPWLPSSVMVNRRHATRVVRYLAGAAGYRQFLDLGCGLPYANETDQTLHTHGAALSVRNDVCTVYVDNDPGVCAHANTELAAHEGTLAVQADVTDIDRLLTMPQVTKVLDLSHPVAVLAHDLLPWIDDDAAFDLACGLHRRLPPGSALSVTHASTETSRSEAMLALREAYGGAGIAFRPRSRGHIRALLGQWHMETPGVVPTELWGVGYGRYAQTIPSGPDTFSGTYAAITTNPTARSSRQE
ncbi:SAM-dependent methyltransferase [Streptomyces sp. NPDC092903]|uniref:SAM-dependent methyltransferase n=1 Tax=Streptomyces sp. NPDC092903 TaxID=3366017 RepID=UPI00381A91C7